MTEPGTRFAILQRSLEIPDVEKLKRAFRLVNGLTASDAHTCPELATWMSGGSAPMEAGCLFP